MDEMKTSNMSWNKQLSQELDLLIARKRSNAPTSKPSLRLKVAVVGAGSELNGDDAAGLWVVRGLNRTLQSSPHFLSIEAGVVPENALGPLRKFRPDVVILIDAADFGEEPGVIRWVENTQIDGFSASSHTLPLGMISSYISGELACPIWLIGVQPASLEFAEPLTESVQRSVDNLITELTRLFER